MKKLYIRTAVVAALATAAVGMGPSSGASQASHGQDEHARIVAFWTNERVAHAVPRDFAYDPTTRSFRPTGKPGGGGGGSSTTLGSSWTGGGEVLAATGKVLFSMGGTSYVCSASVVDDTVSARSIILTAGHCAFDESNGAFATNWMFVPDYDSAAVNLDKNGVFCASTSRGCWTATSLVVASGFATAGSFNTQATVNDFAFAVVGPGGKSGTAQLDATVGGHPIQFTSLSAGADTSLFGYPAGGKYKGKDLVYCRGPLGLDSRNAGLTYRVACDMTGGSSGGPWLSPFSGGSGTLVSVNSYGYSGVTAMHGPMLNSKTAAMFTAATSVTTNTVVP